MKKAKCEKCQHCKLIDSSDQVKCDYLEYGCRLRPNYCPNFIKKSSTPVVTLMEHQKMILEEREEARRSLWIKTDMAIENFAKLEKNIKTDLKIIINHIYVDERDYDKEA